MAAKIKLERLEEQNLTQNILDRAKGLKATLEGGHDK